MRPLAWLLAPLFVFLMGVPVGTALIIATIAIPAAASVLVGPCSTVGADGTLSVLEPLPAPGPERRASLTNQPTDIPAAVLALYQEAAAAHGLPWPLLAGVGMEETNHGRNNRASSAGAQGVMQFMPGTFAAYGIDGNGDGRATITNDADSIHSAANYLAALGAAHGGDSVRAALFGYNRAIWYVNDVLTYAAHYATQACATEDGNLPDGPDGPCPPTGSAAERGLQPSALKGLRCVKAAFPWIRSMGGRGPRPNVSDHPAGRAVDFMIPAWNTREGRARGWQVADWLQAHAAELNVKYLIYDDHVWRAYRSSQGWTRYTHPNGATTNPTLRHLDHVHLSSY